MLRFLPESAIQLRSIPTRLNPFTASSVSVEVPGHAASPYSKRAPTRPNGISRKIDTPSSGWFRNEGLDHCLCRILSNYEWQE